MDGSSGPLGAECVPERALKGEEMSAPRQTARKPAMNWPLDTFLGWQRAGPVHEETASRTHFITGYDEVARLLTDRRLAATPVVDELVGVPEDLRARVRAIEIDFFARWPVFSDPPRHQVLRRAMLPAFHPTLARAAGNTVRSALAAVTPSSDCAGLIFQIRHAFAAGIATIHGFDSDAARTLLEMAESLMGYISQLPEDGERLAVTENTIASLTELAMAHIQIGSDPLAESLRDALSNGDIEAADIAAAYAQLLTGAIEPTTAVIAHAVEVMRTDSSVATAYRHQPAAVLAELFRTATPFHFASRHTTQAVQVGGIDLPAGARVVLLLSAANHDYRHYGDPLAVNHDRTAPPHVAFGRGRHACPGATAAAEMIHAALGWLLSDCLLERAEGTPIPWHVTVGMRTIAAGDRGETRSSSH